jgi:hypothetical protein
MSDEITRETVDYETMRAMHLTLNRSQREAVSFAQGLATAYVWGRQDALGAGARDTGWSTDFGHVYAMHEARYRLERIGYRRTIQDAYERWVTGRPIED